MEWKDWAILVLIFVSAGCWIHGYVKGFRTAQNLINGLCDQMVEKFEGK